MPDACVYVLSLYCAGKVCCKAKLTVLGGEKDVATKTRTSHIAAGKRKQAESIAYYILGARIIVSSLPRTHYLPLRGTDSSRNISATPEAHTNHPSIFRTLRDYRETMVQPASSPQHSVHIPSTTAFSRYHTALKRDRPRRKHLRITLCIYPQLQHTRKYHTAFERG